MVDILVLNISQPLKIGVYKNNKLIEQIETDKKTSDVLPEIFKDLLKEHRIQSLAYINTPGSFMSIKITYIFLKTLSIVKNIPLFGVEGFYFNLNQPIKALAKLYFVKISDKIETKKFDKTISSDFVLPKNLDKSIYSKENEPKYIIGAV